MGGVVGGAVPHVEHGQPVGGEGVVGAGIDAEAAVGAARGRRGVVAVALLGGDDLAQVDPCAPAGRDEERVVPDPAQAGAGGPVLVADGDGVAAGLPVDAQPLTQAEEHFFDHGMVLAALGIGGHAVVTLGVGRPIGADHADDAPCPFDQQAGVHPFLDVAFHVAEVAVPATPNPLAQGVLPVGEGVGTGHAAGVEAHLQSGLFYVGAAYHFITANYTNLTKLRKTIMGELLESSRGNWSDWPLIPVYANFA